MQKFDTYPFLNTDWNSIHLEILENALFTGDSSWYYPQIISPYNRLYFIMDGEIYLENERGRQILRSGHIYLVPAFSCYTYGCPSTVRKFYIHFNMELLPGVDLFSRLETIRQLPCEASLLENIFAELKKESLSGLLHLKAIFWQILYEFFINAASSADYLDRFKGFYRQKQILEYLSANLHAGLRIQDIAEDLHTPSHILSRSFRQDTGQGLKEYMELLLLQKARNLLLHTNMPITEIAETLGFSDPFYFSRFFKKAEHISPREYRKVRF